MSFDEASFKSLSKMIKLMLPYEYDYEPETNPAKTLNDIFQVLKQENLKLGEMEPFLGSLMKKIDQSEDTSKLDKIFMEMGDVIHNRYPLGESPIKRKGIPETMDMTHYDH